MCPAPLGLLQKTDETVLVFHVKYSFYVGMVQNWCCIHLTTSLVDSQNTSLNSFQDKCRHGGQDIMSYCVHSLTSQVFDPLIPNLSSGFPLVTPPKSLSTMKAVTTSCFSPIWSTFCNNQCNKLVIITKLKTKFILILYFLLIHSSGWLLHTNTPSYTPRLSEHPLLGATHYCRVFIRKWSAVCTKHLMKCNNLILEHLQKIVVPFQYSFTSDNFNNHFT